MTQLQSPLPDAGRAGHRQRRAAELRQQAALAQPLHQVPLAASAPTAQQPLTSAPVGVGAHEVATGECVSYIARDAGHLWETIWHDSQNAELRKIRKNPNILMPGDRVAVAPITIKQHPGATMKRHLFVMRDELVLIRVRVMDDNVPRAGQPYTLIVDGHSPGDPIPGRNIRQGMTDGDGWLTPSVAARARSGLLTIGPDNLEVRLQFGQLAPIDTIEGVQDRLENLGFDWIKAGDSRGRLGEGTREALRAYQQDHGLQVNGEPDEPTRVRLAADHGS